VRMNLSQLTFWRNRSLTIKEFVSERLESMGSARAAWGARGETGCSCQYTHVRMHATYTPTLHHARVYFELCMAPFEHVERWCTWCTAYSTYCMWLRLRGVLATRTRRHRIGVPCILPGERATGERATGERAIETYAACMQSGSRHSVATRCELRLAGWFVLRMSHVHVHVREREMFRCSAARPHVTYACGAQPVSWWAHRRSAASEERDQTPVRVVCSEWPSGVAVRRTRAAGVARGRSWLEARMQK